MKLLCKTIKCDVQTKLRGTVQMLILSALMNMILTESTIFLFKSSEKTFPLEIRERERSLSES